MSKRVSASDALFVGVVLVLTFMAARVWWLSKIVPGMDYPQYLVFVRALQDHADPASPFHGTYAVAQWYKPTSLLINVTSWLSYACGHSIERAGKVLWTLENVGVVAASVFTLGELRRNRWAVLLVFPLIHCVWTVAGGFFAFATSLPLVILAWGLTVRWFRAPSVRSGVALGTCFCAVFLRHGIGFAQAGIGFAILWMLWRFPSWRARVLGGVPTLPCLTLFVVWWTSTFDGSAGKSAPGWVDPWNAAEHVVEYVWASVPHYTARAYALVLIVGAGLLLSPTNLGATQGTRTWRVRNPFLLLSLAYLAAYWAFPMYLDKVEGVSARFPYVAALAFVFAWNLPAPAAARTLLLAVVGSFGAWCLYDMSQRFLAFDAYTRGASDLMDRLGPRDTLYCSPPNSGAFDGFDGPTNKPIREIQQYASIRRGGLPNSSFAGYGMNYIRYVNGNPMPGFYGWPGWSRTMTKFDYVLARGHMVDSHFRLVGRLDGWELYGVCGSRRFPVCSP